MKKISIVFFALLFLVACGSGSGGDGKPKTVNLAKLGLKITTSIEVKVGAGVLGDGVLVQGPGVVVNIELVTSSHAKTIAEAKENAEMFTPKNLKTEKLTNGFLISYNNKGSMGENYFVNVRKTIDGKDYWCSTTANNEEFAKNAVAVCKSLTK